MQYNKKTTYVTRVQDLKWRETNYPFFYSFYISITDLSLLRMGSEEIIGLRNYVEMDIEKWENGGRLPVRQRLPFLYRPYCLLFSKSILFLA